MNEQQFFDADRSRKAFREAAPAIEKFFKCRLVSLESHNSDFERQLDQQNCIDGLLLTETDGIVPIAWRCRFVSPKCSSRYFTIRKSKRLGAKTEFEKLTAANNRGGIMPQLIFSVYFYDGDEIYIAYARTQDILNFIQSGSANLRRDVFGDEFYSIQWSDLERLGCLTHVTLPF